MQKLNRIVAVLPSLEVLLAELLGVRGVEIVIDINEEELSYEGLQERTKNGSDNCRD